MPHFTFIPIRTLRPNADTLTMHADDMAELGVTSGATIRVRTATGEAAFQVAIGNVPRGLLFVPHSERTCELMDGTTDGTGMPTAKGWDVEVDVL